MIFISVRSVSLRGFKLHEVQKLAHLRRQLCIHITYYTYYILHIYHIYDILHITHIIFYIYIIYITYYILHILYFTYILYIIHITYYISHILYFSYILYIIHITYYILQCGGIMSVTTKIWMIRKNFKLLLTILVSLFPPGITTSLWLQLWKTTSRRAGSGRSSTIMKRSHCSILLLKENNKGLSKNILAIGGMRRWIIGCPLALIL